MQMDGHGGGCCGIRHLHSFFGGDGNVLREVKLYLERTNKHASGAADIDNMAICEAVQRAGSRKRGKIIEIVLTDEQVYALPKTCQYLKEYGFKLVHRFDNATGSICNVLHYCFSTLPNEQSPFENLPKVEEDPVVQQGERRMPQVGEVWRINNNTYYEDRHCYSKNTFVRITDSVLRYGGRVRVDNIRPFETGWSAIINQLVALDDISFIRSEA